MNDSLILMAGSKIEHQDKSQLVASPWQPILCSKQTFQDGAFDYFSAQVASVHTVHFFFYKNTLIVAEPQYSTKDSFKSKPIELFFLLSLFAMGLVGLSPTKDFQEKYFMILSISKEILVFYSVVCLITVMAITNYNGVGCTISMVLLLRHSQLFPACCLSVVL